MVPLEAPILALYVHITEACFNDANTQGFRNLIENVRDSIEDTQNLIGFEFLSVSSLKKKLGRNLRLIAHRHPVDNDTIILFLRVIARGSNDYERIIRQDNPDTIVDRFQPYTDEQIGNILAKRTEVEPLIPRRSPNDEERKWLYNVFHGGSQQEMLIDDLFVLETESWTKNIKSQSFVPFLASYRKLLEQMTYTERLRPGNTECDLEILWDRDHEIGILYYYRPDMKRLLLLEPLFEHAVDTVKREHENLLHQAIASQNTFSGIAVRSYPLLMVLDAAAWIAIQQDREANLALSPEETKLVEDIREAGIKGSGGYPLFINGRAGSGKSTMLQYLAAEYVNFALRAGTDLVPLYMTYSKDLLERAREIVRGLITTHYSALLERGGRCLDEGRIDRQLHESFRVFDEYLYSLLPPERQQTFQKDHYVPYAVFRRLWSEQFARRPDARGLSPEVCWHVIRSYIKGSVRTSRDDDLNPDEFDALPRKRRTVLPDLYRRIYRDVWERWYKRLCDDQGYWDDQDLAAEVLDVGIDDDVRRVAIFCDEAQDYTPVELEIIFQLSLFSRLSLESHDIQRVPILFAGDQLQTINPTGFRWDAVKADFHDRFYAILDPHRLGRHGREPIEIKELGYNYRSNPGIVKFCNLIQLVRAAVFGGPDIRPQKSWWVDASMTPVWFDVNDPETANKLDRPGLIKLVDCPAGEEGTYVSKDQPLRKLEQSDDVYRNVMSPTRAKGLEFPAVVLYRFGEEAPDNVMDLLSGNISLEDPEQRLPWEYFFNRLYVAASRAKGQLIVVESKETIEKFWRFATDPDVFEFLLGRIEDGECWKDAAKAHLLPGSSDEWEREHVDPRLQAEDFASQGRRDQDSYLLRLAGLAYRNIDRDHDAEKCFAQADECDGKQREAGERYSELQLYEDALRCYWNGELWQSIKKLATQNRNLAFGIESRAADFMTSTEAPSVSFLKQIISASMDDKWLKYAVVDTTWNRVLMVTTDRLISSSEEILISWDELLQTFVRFVELGGRVNSSHIAEIAYLARNYRKAVDFWDSDRNTDHGKYYQAKARIAPFPDCIAFFGRIGDHSEVLRRWREKGLQESAVKATPTDVIRAVVDAALEHTDFRLALRMIELRPSRDLIAKLIKKAVNVADESTIKGGAVLAARSFVRTCAWTDVVSAVDLTSIAQLAGTADITLGGQPAQRQKEIRSTVLTALVRELAVSDDLTKESPKTKEPVAWLLYRHFISGSSIRDIPVHVVGAAIERAGRIVDALQYYEKLLIDESKTSDMRRFAAERLIRNLERHVEYFQLKGDTTEAERRRRRLTELRDKEGIGDRKLADYPMVGKESLHDLSGEKNRSHPFWETPTLGELARSQKVQPMTNVETIFGTWPGEENDGFELTIEELRHPMRKNGSDGC